MGAINCDCQKNTEEKEDAEAFVKIFNTMTIRRMDIKEVYSEFTKCINAEKCQLEMIEYNNLIDRFASKQIYRDAHKEYFENLVEINGNNINSIKRIGIILIYLANGIKDDKIFYLEKHIKNFYNKNEKISDKIIKEIISDIIELNTDICLLSFNKYIDDEHHKRMNLVWKKHRKQKLILKIFNIFEERIVLSSFLSNAYQQLSGEGIRNALNEDYNFETNRMVTIKR